MKILHFSAIYAPAWKWGGPPRSVANLAEGLAANGHEVTVLTTDAGLETDSTLVRGRAVERNGVQVTYFPSRWNFLGLNSPELTTAVAARAGEFDVIHLSGVWQPTGPAAGRAAGRAGVPYVVSPRGMLGPYSFTQGRLKKFIYWRLVERSHLRRAGALHATSAMEATELSGLLAGLPVFNVPNAIDTAAWTRNEAAGGAWRVQNGIAPDVPLFLASGRLHHKKGLEFLSEALALLPSGQDWRMVFAGPDEDGTKARLEGEFAAAGLGGRVMFCGQRNTSELAVLYSAADGLLFPSRHENFGNVAVEALACGCPVVLSDGVGAARDLASFPGVRVEPREPAKWAAAIRDVIAGRAEMAARRPALALAVEARFGQRGVATAVAAHYANIAPGR